MTTNNEQNEDIALSPNLNNPNLDASQSLAPILLLTSHGHSPPLQPLPVLKYDLRSVPNPPKGIRDNYTGLDKRLRSHMNAQVEFAELLARAEGEILEMMERMDVGSEVKLGGEADAMPNERVLSVGCFCERGKHRSVAFVEELGRRKWPKQWIVRVVHRDVHTGRDSTGKHIGNMRKTRLKESYFEED
jgi:RNase adaptor protein for sRNA GlmZ degradation